MFRVCSFSLWCPGLSGSLLFIVTFPAAVTLLFIEVLHFTLSLVSQRLVPGYSVAVFSLVFHGLVIGIRSFFRLTCLPGVPCVWQ